MEDGFFSENDDCVEDHIFTSTALLLKNLYEEITELHFRIENYYKFIILNNPDKNELINSFDVKQLQLQCFMNGLKTKKEDLSEILTRKSFIKIFQDEYTEINTLCIACDAMLFASCEYINKQQRDNK